MLLFQDSLGKPVPEWQTILDFNATRDDGGGDAADGNLCTAPVISPPPECQYTQRCNNRSCRLCKTQGPTTLRVHCSKVFSLSEFNQIRPDTISVDAYIVTIKRGR